VSRRRRHVDDVEPGDVDAAVTKVSQLQFVHLLPHHTRASSSAALFLLFYYSPNLSGRRWVVYHASTHGVALVRI